ncbi:MAG TPA: permease [Candidatus Krumholzibacteria bacterium]|nr:permease [Candidatus Krumholzibacteria bacterium]
MSLRHELKPALLALGGFLLLYHLPVDGARFDGAVHEAFALARWYAREHVVLCLVPAFFIAGGISVFTSQAAVMRHLGAGAGRVKAYAVASVAGTVLAVCSCTVLPLFAGIYGMGAGIGPASAFLYSGPAVSALAVILTARVLGVELGVARAVGAVVFSVVIGLAMQLMFRGDARERALAAAPLPADDARPLARTAWTFAAMVAVLVFANWGGAGEGLFGRVHAVKWWLAGGAAGGLGAALVAWYGLPWWKVPAVAAAAGLGALIGRGDPLPAFAAGAAAFAWALGSTRGELSAWLAASWGFARQILPLLLMGVLGAGLLLGRPGHEGLVPTEWIARAVGGNGPVANLAAAVAGAFMYFATLTEVPILEGLRGAGMGAGPSLTLLLAGPALSLPSILVLRTIMGTRRTLAFLGLVVVLSAVTGTLYGALA